MAATATPNAHDPSPTRAVATWAAEVASADITPSARAWGRHALLDWFGVTLGGCRDPLVDILAEDAVDEGAAGECRLIGRAERVIASRAAQINGAASHALDFDDVNHELHGHATVAVAPAVIATAERTGASGRDLVEAFVIGYEVACRISAMIGMSHYERGFHATATIGTFGAAAGAGRLLGLDADRMTMALGVAATSASGLKSMFGTMTKPLHAGRAAMNGLAAARLAARGFTANPHSIEAPQGFAATQSDGLETGEAGMPGGNGPFAVESNLFKYHAACYLTHSSIEAMRQLRAEHGLEPGDLATITPIVSPVHLDVCNIEEPDTGLEVKFSLRHTVAMAAAGVDTGDVESYSDSVATRADLVTLRRRVTLRTEPFEDHFGARVQVSLTDGRTLEREVNVGLPATDLAQQWQRLEAKYLALAVPVLGERRARALLDLIATLEEHETIDPVLAAAVADG